MTSARTKPFWMSEWISPAACQAVQAAAQVPGLRRLVLAGGEERDQVEQRERAVDHAPQAGLGDAEVGAHRGGVLVVELGQLGLQPRRRSRPRRAPCDCGVPAISGGTSSSPSSTLATNSTGLAVSGERSRTALGASSGTGTVRDRAARLQRLDRPRAATPPRRSRPCRRRAPSRTTRVVAALGLLEVGVDQLGLDRLDVAQRVDRALGVDDVRVVVRADDVDDRVGLADVREELVAEPLALAGARDQAGDVVEVDRVGDDRSRRRRSRRPCRAARRATATTATFGSIVVNG